MYYYYYYVLLYTILDYLHAGIAVSNPVQGVDVPSALVCVVLSCLEMAELL
jgi:hypothetical protein